MSSLGLLQRIDYLSTVSGGGYTGAFYCGLFASRGDHKPIIDTEASGDLLGQPDARKALGYLRQSGRYLTPAGGRDFVYAAALVFRNWFALTLVVGVAIVLGELLLDFARSWLAEQWPAYGKVIWLSPLAPLLLPLVVAVVGTGWAYWLTMADASPPWLRPPLIGTVLCLLAAYYRAFGWAFPHWPEDWPGRIAAILAILALKGLIDWAAAFAIEQSKQTGTGRHECIIVEDRTRHRLNNWQAVCTQLLLWTLLVVIADTVTFAFALDGYLPMIWSMLTAAGVPVGRSLVTRLATLSIHHAAAGSAQTKPSFLDRFGSYLAWIAAGLFALAALAFWGGVAHWLAWQKMSCTIWQKGSLSPGCDAALFTDGTFAFAIIACTLFVVLAATTQGFINLSSLATFYADRLRRAYLGAGNPQRIGAGRCADLKHAAPVHDSDPLDDMGLHAYYARAAAGAPVHLINVTVNETRGKGPATVQRDRHGLNMVISPDGMSYSKNAQATVTTKLLCDEDRRQWIAANGPALTPQQMPGQNLALSTWIGISGAAFTTGLGSATSLAKSALAFFANVRLGYWWKANRASRCLVPSYLTLSRELGASFPGTSGSQWYLSDGGHFENTAVYELVRRRVPFIIASDNGCDPKFGFEDIANLVRKCRIDFGAEIVLLNAHHLDQLIGDDGLRALFATPAQFAQPDAIGGAIAMLGKITYADGTKGTLLVIKPRLTQDGPADLMRYLSNNPDFPQQTTLDQFFDEAQWESYYELGRLISRKLFETRDRTDWQPSTMISVPWDDQKGRANGRAQARVPI